MPHGAEGSTPTLSRQLDFSEIDGRVLRLFDDKSLRAKVIQKAESRLTFGDIWRDTLERVHGYQKRKRSRVRSNPIQTHRKIVEGLSGTAMFISSAMLWDNLAETEAFWGLTAKTLRSRLTTKLSPAEGELSVRAARATDAAAAVLGSYESARQWLRTANFALGGLTPRELLKTAEGERIVLNELHTESESGPL